MSDTISSGQFSLAGVSAAAATAFREGRKASSEQEFLKAIQYFTEALDFDRLPALFQARVFEYRGLCFWLIGEFRAAEKDYNESLITSDNIGQKARARVRLGELADFRGEYDVAAALYEEALQEGIATENLLVVGRARRGLGILDRRQGNTERALRQLTQALAIFRQGGETREQGRVLTSLGRTRQARGEYQQALSAHREAYLLLESVNDRWRVAQAVNDIGECHQALYDVEKAYEHHQNALNLATDAGAKLLIPEIKRNLGVDLVESGQYDQGLVYLQAALQGTREHGNREHEALTLYQLARAYLQHGDDALAVQVVLALTHVAEMLNADRYRALAAFAHGELLFHQGRKAEALNELNLAMLAAQTAVDRGILWKLHATMSHVSENEQIAAVHLNIAAEFIRQTAEPLQDERLRQCFLNAPPVLAVLQAAQINPNQI
ncbi:tetratricopeptide repeat protein [Candidatus Leptofilum sp.]|uniref:tetratricopeptide repeat protein n=1 Tax=Candidatus Leptofilum sp. TaxID=3241576 RepID=UPI003B5CB01A